GQPFTVIVDYAHTADGLQRLLKAVRSLGSGRVVMVFGCGGDRDASKRAPMGRIAGELADHVILTSDNPRSEDPADIAAQVARGMEGCSASWEVVLDRREALTRAVEAAGAGDFLVAAGRGSESVQVFRDRVEPFDDREVLRDLLAPYVQRASQPGRTGERPQKMAGENGATVGCCATDCSARASDAVSPWSLGAIVRMTGGEVAGVSPEQWAVISSCLASGVALDSREVSGGEVFIALPGRRVDGHDFIAAAFAAGAQAALAQRARWGRVVEAPAEAVRGKAGPAKAPAETAGGERVTSPGLHIIVDDTLEAMQRWAAGLRLQVNPRVVAVTGSSGKTTTKEMILALLRPLGNVIGTVGNRNNEIGLPWTLLTLRPGVQWAVLEMGTNHPGEIETLSRLARPDVAVISCVGYAHEGFLGGREGVLKAKLEILTGLSPGGALVIPDDDPQLEQAVAERWNGRLVRFGRTEASDIRATEISYGLDGTRLAIAGFPAPLHLQLLGEGGARAALAALAVLRALGVESVDARVMEQVAALPGRLQPMRAGRVTWLLDMYNASPESTLYNLRFLEGIEAGGRKIFVFGGMQELGESSDARHREIGRAAGFCDTGFFVGPEARTCIPEAQGAGLEETFWCASVEDAIDLLRRHLDDGDVVLLKGARSSGLERIALELGVIDESCGEGGH
ncbi:MAG: UDP-N-acetylmuramoyl-tripeptide--D-alanyl-D-alanine ligase, partial [Candidatus Eisenbacteria sp.]|nr:UDP-N-acetylmuramoyl-tripeptide--D-alanyl-D-alanine ligase [Candidatus Eisenbacteria bacterium]